jgi:hypothetical protein
MADIILPESESVQDDIQGLGIDAELQALLGDLGSLEQEVAAETEQTQIQINRTVPEPELTEPAPEPEESQQPYLPIESTPIDLTDIKEVVRRFDRDYDEVQTSLKIDRSKIDMVISILLNRVQNGSASEADTISLVKALSVLADTNGHSVKLLDSRSKLLSATKSSINAVQTNVSVTGSDVELQNILQQPTEEEQ